MSQAWQDLKPNEDRYISNAHVLRLIDLILR